MRPRAGPIPTAKRSARGLDAVAASQKPPIQRGQKDRTWWQTPAENFCRKRSLRYCDIQGPHSRSEKHAGYSRAKIKAKTSCNDVCRRTGRRKTPLMDSSSSSTTHHPDIYLLSQLRSSSSHRRKKNDLHYLSRVCAKQDHMRIKSRGFEPNILP